MSKVGDFGGLPQTLVTNSTAFLVTSASSTTAGVGPAAVAALAAFTLEENAGAQAAGSPLTLEVIFAASAVNDVLVALPNIGSGALAAALADLTNKLNILARAWLAP